MNTGEIWLVDEDEDDAFTVQEILHDLNLDNTLKSFNEAEKFLMHLAKVDEAPFVVLCDINMPKMDGFELREKMLTIPDKKFHSVPFIFWSSYASESQITRAYNLSAHGFFIKEAEIDKLKENFKLIVDYWSRSKMPSKRSAPDPFKID